MIEGGDAYPVSYPSLRKHWEPSRQQLRLGSRNPISLITLNLSGHETSLQIPLEFVASSGDNTLAFVKFLASMLVTESGVLLSQPGREPAHFVDLSLPPQSTTYYFEPESKLTEGAYSWCSV